MREHEQADQVRAGGTEASLDLRTPSTARHLRPLLSKTSWDAIEPPTNCIHTANHTASNCTRVVTGRYRVPQGGRFFLEILLLGSRQKAPRFRSMWRRIVFPPPPTPPPMPRNLPPWGTGTLRSPMRRTTSHSIHGTSPPIVSNTRPKLLGAKPLPISRALHRTFGHRQHKRLLPNAVAFLAARERNSPRPRRTALAAPT